MMQENILKTIYFGNDDSSIKLLYEVTDGTSQIVCDNQKFKDKSYLKDLSGNQVVIIDGDGIDLNILSELINCLRNELKIVGIIYTASTISTKDLSYLFNELQIHWFLPKPWQGQTLAKALKGTEDKVLKELKPLPKPLTAVDPLTGLPNYSSFRLELALEFERSTRSAASFSVIRINFDGTSKLNSNLGFTQADQVIRDVTLSIRKFLPRQVFLARLGADDLAIIARSMNFQFAEKLAEEIRKHIIKSGFPLSLSLGVGSYPTHSRTLEEFLALTEQALTTAKRRGKNQTVVVNLA